MEPFKRPEVKKPRLRFSRLPFLSKELFNKFRETYPDHPIKDWKTYKNFVVDCNKAIADLALEDRAGVDLPFASGKILLKSYTPTNVKITDIGKSNKYEIRVYNKNYETDDRVCKITYTVYNKKFTPFSKKAWGFRACRDFKRLASKKFVDNPNFYIHKVNKDANRRNYKQNTDGAQTDALRYEAD